MVQLILNPTYFPLTNVAEIRLFGEVLADESVGVFIQRLFPRTVRTAEIGFSRQCFGYSGVAVEFLAVIHGDGVHPVFMRPQRPNDGIGRILGFEVLQFADNGVAGNPFDQCQ